MLSKKLLFFFKNFYLITIPHYLIILFFPMMASYIIMAHALPKIDFFLYFSMIGFATLGFNSINMVFDSEIDKLTKPDRPLPSGKISWENALLLGIILYLFSIFLSFYTKPEIILLNMLFILIGIIYSAPIIHLKKYFWSSSLVGLIIYGAIPFLIIFYGTESKEFPVYFFLMFTSFIFFISNSKDLEDAYIEKELKINSFPAKFGYETTVIIINLGLALTNFSFILLPFFGIEYTHFMPISIISSLTSLITIPFFLKKAREIKHKQIVRKELHQIISTPVTQAKIVTYYMLLIVFFELGYAYYSLIPI